ncbi:PREDICTED: uncharacterized protein LOC105572813 [Cercocebus atys]|uniref:uncharacterized protein LOC105572813 n=1 Tax=Cercocebus atys TaxID=9531 RepID=UPI0005F36AFF|nr:PREDICTED: uncharacterized protein LOC105572813 [Cercocebus atys]
MVATSLCDNVTEGDADMKTERGKVEQEPELGRTETSPNPNEVKDYVIHQVHTEIRESQELKKMRIWRMNLRIRGSLQGGCSSMKHTPACSHLGVGNQGLANQAGRGGTCRDCGLLAGPSYPAGGAAPPRPSSVGPAPTRVGAVLVTSRAEAGAGLPLGSCVLRPPRRCRARWLPIVLCGGGGRCLLASGPGAAGARASAPPARRPRLPRAGSTFANKRMSLPKWLILDRELQRQGR